MTKGITENIKFAFKITNSLKIIRVSHGKIYTPMILKGSDLNAMGRQNKILE